MTAQLPARIVYLDLDDVLADFRTAACNLIGADPEETNRLCREKNEWDISKAHGIPSHVLWTKIAEKGEAFWTSLSLLGHATELIELVAKTNCLFQTGRSELANKSKHVYVLSSPGIDPEGTATVGKLLWLKRNFGKGYTNGIITPHKELLARPGSILIDDKPENCERWEQAGGSSILFPGPVANNQYVGKELQFVRAEIMRHILGE